MTAVKDSETDVAKSAKSHQKKQNPLMGKFMSSTWRFMQNYVMNPTDTLH